MDVVEQKKNFFSRELILKLSNDESNTSSEIIQTKLTALPFAVLADSALIPSFVKELNKNFKVTIDKIISPVNFLLLGIISNQILIPNFAISLTNHNL
ncbi:hypothetical protein [Avibacterium endocarditidis]|uniref:hypothetical protein n=1 Tax=Avibacterium endocarditidis TaxID=380674 RepID=UPI0011B6C983|nr:hypothetical protein [Avibacterium endocarditidis]